MTRGRLIGFLLCAASIIGLAAAIPNMARRLSHRALPVVWFDDPIPNPVFEFLGEPAEIRTTDPQSPEERPALEIHWRGETRTFAIEEGMRDDPRLPGLLRHDDWLRILAMAEGARSQDELKAGIAQGTIHPRLIIAMRLPAEGFDPESWGAVRRREWRYRFVELLPASRSPSKSFETHEGTYAGLDKLGDPKFVRDNNLQPEAWKYAAMQQVTPATLFRSKSRPIDDAMLSMGWTWPVAGVSVLALVVGLLLLAMAAMTRDHDAPPNAAARH